MPEGVGGSKEPLIKSARDHVIAGRAQPDVAISKLFGVVFAAISLQPGGHDHKPAGYA